MKSSTFIPIVVVFLLGYCSIASCADDNLELIIPGNQDDGKQENPSPVAVDDVDTINQDTSDLVGSGGDEYFHGFSREEIEKNRIITQHRNGTMTVSSDEEVIKTLEYVRKSKFINFLHDEPHFTREEKRNVIGSDGRYSRNQNIAPYSVMGYLSASGFRCTAYLVGPRHLVTAAHCLHPDDRPGDIYGASQISFYLRRTCSASGTPYSVSDVLTYAEYRRNGHKDYDIACLLLSSTVSNWMGYAYHDPMPTVSGEVCGYPGDRNNCFVCSRCSNIRRLTTGWWIFPLTNSNRLQYTCDTEGGTSGGPVVTDDHDSTSTFYSYGVHTQGGSGSNYGVRITKNYFYDICRWKCNTGARCSAVC